MKDSEYNKVIELANIGGGFIPANDNAEDLLLRTKKGEVVVLKEITQRDLSFHRCYMVLLVFIWEYMPRSFKDVIRKDMFYKWLKHFKGEYDIKFKIKDGTQLIEYTSISFGNMGQKEFEAYVAEQLPFIYSNVIGAYFEGDMYDSIISTIETEFKVLLSKLP